MVILQRVYKYRLITPNRIELLDIIGFIWDIHESLWQESYVCLVEFHNKFGHCNVSKGQKEYVRLAEWAAKQRKDKSQNEPRLPQEKIDKLNKLGFEWSIYKRFGWEKQYQNLIVFHKIHGHCRVKTD